MKEEEDKGEEEEKKEKEEGNEKDKSSITLIEPLPAEY